MNHPRTRPFPWTALDSISRAEAGALRDVKRWAAGQVRIDLLAPAFAELLEAEVELLVRRVRFGGRSLEDGVALLLTHADADVIHDAVVEVESALAANVVSRALKRSPPVVPSLASDLPASIGGAFAAVVVAAARRAHAGIPLRLAAVGPAAALQAELTRRRGPELVAVSLTVLVARDAFAARVVVARDEFVGSAVASSWDARALAALGPVPLAIPVVACVTRATVAEMAALRPGDAFVPMPAEDWPLARNLRGTLTGPVWLAPPGTALGLPAELVENGRLVLRGGVEPLVPAEAPMNSNERDPIIAAIGEVPIVVRVEIGEAVMTAREWASLGRGDIVPLGRRLGEAVVLRVEGVPLARGELVDLDGEVAVRIVERVATGGSPP